MPGIDLFYEDLLEFCINITGDKSFVWHLKLNVSYASLRDVHIHNGGLSELNINYNYLKNTDNLDIFPTPGIIYKDKQYQ